MKGSLKQKRSMLKYPVEITFEALDTGHDRKSFECGEPALDEFLRKQAKRHQEVGVSRTVVLTGTVPDPKKKILGYYLVRRAFSFGFVIDHQLEGKGSFPKSFLNRYRPTILRQQVPFYMHHGCAGYRQVGVEVPVFRTGVIFTQ